MQQNKTWPMAALVAVMALVLGAVGGYLVRSATDDGDDTTVAAADAGDTGTISIRLEPANFVGPDPFSPEPFAPEPDPAIATIERVPVDTVELTLQIAEEKPAAPGLYGGSGENVCEVEPMIEFLEADPAKAKAWVDVQNADPLLRWDQTLTVDTLGDYLRSLTPATLAADTLVTNHSYSNGVATPIVSLLQAGTAVLVDAYGVPRAKCYCGNPLTPAPPLEGDFELDPNSDPWPNAGRDGTRPNPDPADPTTDIRQNTCDAFRRSNIPSDQWPPRCEPAPGTEPAPTASAAEPTPTTTAEATPTAAPDSTPTPEPTPTAEPTATPEPTATAEPTATPTPIPTDSAAPLTTYCTPNATTDAATMVVVNNSTEPVWVWWHDFNCQPQPFFRLEPGERLPGNGTFVGHVWSAVRADGSEVSTFTVPSAGRNVWTVN